MKIQAALKERVNNFTLMRLVAALGVLYFHCFALSLGQNAADFYPPMFRDLVISIGKYAVDMFFVISGFLVTASYSNKPNLLVFFAARGLRIFPGLVAANVFCVWVVGALVTTEPLSRYLFAAETFGFVKHNVLLLQGIQLQLPGVFSHNPYPDHVNGSLWTLSVELIMYCWVAILGVCSILHSPKVFNAVCILVLLLYTQYTEELWTLYGKHQLRVALLFLLGNIFYVNRKVIPLNFPCLLGLALLLYWFRQFDLFAFVPEIFFAYCVLIGALHPKLYLPALASKTDISYGVYIYAFPIQQLCAYYFPGITPLNMLLLALPMTLILAIFSWRYIESPALKLKAKVSHVSIFKNAV